MTPDLAREWRLERLGLAEEETMTRDEWRLERARLAVECWKAHIEVVRAAGYSSEYIAQFNTAEGFLDEAGALLAASGLPEPDIGGGAEGTQAANMEPHTQAPETPGAAPPPSTPGDPTSGAAAPTLINVAWWAHDLLAGMSSVRAGYGFESGTLKKAGEIATQLREAIAQTPSAPPSPRTAAGDALADAVGDFIEQRGDDGEEAMYRRMAEVYRLYRAAPPAEPTAPAPVGLVEAAVAVLDQFEVSEYGGKLLSMKTETGEQAMALGNLRAALARARPEADAIARVIAAARRGLEAAKTVPYDVETAQNEAVALEVALAALDAGKGEA